MIPSHCAIFNLDTTSGGRVVYEDNIVYNFNNIGSHEPGVPVFQLTSYTEDSLTRFQWILGTALQKNLKKRRKVTSIRKKGNKEKDPKVKKIENKKTKRQEISVPAAAEEIRIQRTRSKRRKQSEESLRKPHCS